MAHTLSRSQRHHRSMILRWIGAAIIAAAVITLIILGWQYAMRPRALGPSVTIPPAINTTSSTTSDDKYRGEVAPRRLIDDTSPTPRSSPSSTPRMPMTGPVPRMEP